MQKKTGRKKVRWGREAFGAAGRVLAVILNVLLTVLLIGLITGTTVGCAFAIYISRNIDASIDDIVFEAQTQDRTTRFYYLDYSESPMGVPVELEDQRLYGNENRIWVSYNVMPSYLVTAFVSIEDHRFWDHKGVDWRNTLGATLKWAIGADDMRGGSTITQQLIKNLTGDKEVTVQRKVKEILKALNLEKKKEKTEILEMYLNLIYLSQGCYGVQTAAYTYFGKDVSELNLIECAAIAAITQNPSRWDPIRHPEQNQLRRDAVLKRMYELGKITKEEFDSAYNKKLTLNPQYESNVASTTSWYMDAAIVDAAELLAEAKGVQYDLALKMLFTGGYDVYLAMDNDIQTILEDYFKNNDNFTSVDNSVIQPEASMVIMDPKDGRVLGIAGGRGEKTGARILNYATQTTRSPGSSIKPLSVYGPALEYGLITYGSTVDDTPMNFGTETLNKTTGAVTYSDKNGYPDNYPAGNRGLTTINDAIKRSVNTIAVKLLERLTLKTSYDFLTRKLHFTTLIESKETVSGTITDLGYSALALGGMNYGVTVKEMTAAYSIFVNDGIYNEPRIVLKIMDSEGNIVVSNDVESTVVISEQNAYIMTKMMEGVVKSGTATAITLDEKVNVAGKTGTTSSDNDRWFMGYTPYYVGGVWFGYAIPQTLKAFSATVSPSVVIWDDVMTQVHQKVLDRAAAGGESVRSFSVPENIVTVTYCKDSGKLMTEACKADPRGNRAEVGYFSASNAPTEECDCHVLVDYDTVTGGIAKAGCPAANVKQVGLLRVAGRSFPFQIIITDAQYVYYTAEEIAARPYGTYVGVSNVAQQYNSYCTAHSDYKAPVTLPDSGDDDDDDDNDDDGNRGFRWWW